MSDLSDDEQENIHCIIDGFKIVSMDMRDSSSKNKVLWQSTTEFNNLAQADTIDIRLPKQVLKCKAVSRTMTFSSVHSMQNFHIEQQILLHDQLIEQWQFTFGFVIPNSTNSWENVIEAADSVATAEQLSGNLIIDTYFYDGAQLVSNFKIRVFYV